jgi:tetratricopeptide (TPR) repeat protein
MVLGRRRDPRRTWLWRGVVGLLALLVVIGLASGGSYLYLRTTGNSGRDSLAEDLRGEEVDPSIGLSTLAGAPDMDVVNQALDEDEVETAYATTLFSTQLSDREMIGSLLLVGEAYADTGNKARAQSCYRQAALISTLSPTLSDSGRALSLIEIGGLLAESGDQEEAAFNYDQAFALAAHGPLIRDPLRADLLGELADEYANLGLDAKGEESRALEAEIRYSAGEGASPATGEPEQPVANFLKDIPCPEPAMVTSYTERRVDGISDLIEFLQESSGRDAVPQDLATEVTQALVNEDQARAASYEDELAAASSLVLRIGIAESRVDWIRVKYRIALGGYGLDLVPAWSSDVVGVSEELKAAHQELHAIYGEQIDTFGDSTAKDRAWFDVLRLEIMQGILGLYPDYPEQELISELTEVTERLNEAGDTSLHPEVVYEDGAPRFRLAWAD